ncbi:MAG: valine--tRNA ligase [Saprospiraceae bacterium]|nr:valine--tRNA ligase [Saprospiraceae bacterium]
MDITSKYDPSLVEDKWYAHWMENNYFHSEPDEREPYTIVIPPPNVTGVLHMGHMLNNTIQDILIRRARLEGKNACWVPGTDHASIATEAKVVKQLAEQGIKKSDIGREAFLEKAFEWKEKYGGIILEQLKKLGASCDWDRTRFTMEDRLSEAVKQVFVDLHKKGHVYRDLRMTNWDPKAQTALSNEEVNYKEENSKLFHIRYQIEGSEDFVTIATTRPETILADTAICVHPEDARYTHLKGKRAIIPLIKRSIPFIFDAYVDMEFGTGALKVTPAHDQNDNDLGKKHDLEVIDMFNADATLNENAQRYIGQDRFVVRKQIAKDLDAAGHLVEVEHIQNKVGYSERTDVVIEPRLTLQWFLDMPTLVKPALDNVLDDTIQFYPKKFKNTYRHWMENIQNWCISRQLWWGQQIPAFYYGDNEVVVALTKEEALELARQQSSNQALTLADLKQDEDVFDTWFSSWLWPITVFDGFQKNNAKAQKELDYYYPTSTLVTGPDIIFFWVARMIMSGYEYMDEKPFSQVYFTGLVRDSQRRKMSKSLGNSPDPIGLINAYGADGVRVGMLLSAPAGNDLLFDEKLCEQGRNFCNKMWNALRLVKSWKVEDKDGSAYQPAVDWFENRLVEARRSLEASFKEFRVSEALMTNYTLFWGDFTDWYLEMVKPPYGEAIPATILEATISFFEELMQLLHPFTPFITEEIWHLLRERKAGDDLIISAYEAIGPFQDHIAKEGEQLKTLITKVREIRAKDQLKNQDRIKVFVKAEDTTTYSKFEALISKLCGVEELAYVTEEVAETQSFAIKGDQFFVHTGKTIDVAAEKAKMQEELGYLKGFLISVEKKLSNERFVNNAPEAVVAKEKQKQADAEAKIKVLEESLAKL